MERRCCSAEDDWIFNICLSSAYLVTGSYPVDDVFQVSDHLLLPEVGRECFRPLSQQLQDFGTKLAHSCLVSINSNRHCEAHLWGSIGKRKHYRNVGNSCLHAEHKRDIAACQ